MPIQCLVKRLFRNGCYRVQRTVHSRLTDPVEATTMGEICTLTQQRRWPIGVRGSYAEYPVTAIHRIEHEYLPGPLIGDRSVLGTGLIENGASICFNDPVSAQVL